MVWPHAGRVVATVAGLLLGGERRAAGCLEREPMRTDRAPLLGSEAAVPILVARARPQPAWGSHARHHRAVLVDVLPEPLLGRRRLYTERAGSDLLRVLACAGAVLPILVRARLAAIRTWRLGEGAVGHLVLLRQAAPAPVCLRREEVGLDLRLGLREPPPRDRAQPGRQSERPPHPEQQPGQRDQPGVTESAQELGIAPCPFLLEGEVGS